MKQAEKVIAFIEQFLSLGGSFYGEPFILLDFQKEIIRKIFATDEDNNRKVRTSIVGLPRKNGKSALASALAVYMLCADDTDKAPVVICAAGDRMQARIIHDETKRMIEMSPELNSVCTIYRNEIQCHRNGGIFRVVSKDSKLQEGLNSSAIFFDELHTQANSELWDVLNLGSATRNSPLTVGITTAGYDMDSTLLGSLYKRGRKIESGEEEDDSFCFIWHGPTDNSEFEVSDPKVWEQFNPAWEFMNQKEFESAFKGTHEAAFIRYRLNGWTRTESSWFKQGVFEERAVERRLEAGERVVLGFDGSVFNDSTAITACTVEEPRFLQVIGLWEKPEGQHGMGWRVSVPEVEDCIRQACKDYSVEAIYCDPYRWEASLHSLAAEKLPIVECPTSSAPRMQSATQIFYDSVMDKKLTHSGEPALQRHVGNAVLREDARGARITKDRRNSSRKIDLCISAMLSVYGATTFVEEQEHNEAQLIVL